MAHSHGKHDGHPHEEHDHGSHDHGGVGHSHGHGADRRALAIVFALTTSFVAVEVVGGGITGSLALLADAGHMASDSASLGLALFAVWIAGKPATPNRSFGYKRAAGLLTNPAKHGCRPAERNPKALKVPRQLSHGPLVVCS